MFVVHRLKKNPTYICISTDVPNNEFSTMICGFVISSIGWIWSQLLWICVALLTFNAISVIIYPLDFDKQLI